MSVSNAPMIPSFKDLQVILDHSGFTLHHESAIAYLLTDSRKAIVSPGSLFFAIDGPRHDGHQFLTDLYAKGIRQFVVEKKVDPNLLPEANLIQVPGSIAALQKIATYHRRQFVLPVIGITGSNGKTIVKEWLYQLLIKKQRVVKSPLSYNSQIGVPLSVWQLSKNSEMAIFEAGISTREEMQNLEQIIRPTLGIFTNLGTAHSEGFENQEEKAEEKAKLFRNTDKVIYCLDHLLVNQAIRQLEVPVFTWGKMLGADLQIINSQKAEGETLIRMLWKEAEKELHIPFSDRASIENALHCVACLTTLGYDFREIQEGIAELREIPMRLELKKGINQCYLIDDTYNNDLWGLQAALEFLEQQNLSARKTVVLSDIQQSGLEHEALYRQVADLLKAKQVDRLVGVGTEMIKNREKFSLEKSFYPDTASFLQDDPTFQGEMILVKGARTFAFESIINKLQQKIHGTVLEIDLNALTHNLNFYRSQLQPQTRIMVMVKAFAYGSGSFEVAHLLQYHKVDYLGVAYADEGVALREHGINIPIMVMNPAGESFDSLLKNNLEPEIYSPALLAEFTRHLAGRKAGIHIKLDTGMRRLGFEEEELTALIDHLKEHVNLEVKSVLSHLSGADEDEHDRFSDQQASQFIKMVGRLEQALSIRPIKHLLNSPGIMRFPRYHFDMVRLGIGLYGVDTNRTHQDRLQSISTLKTVISQIKHVPKGETIGYGRKGKAHEDITIATIAIGYADGFNRMLSNGKGEVLIKGQKAPVIGNVCMDMTMVDITGIDASEGDEVVIFGPDLPITDLAEKLNTIPYEVLTNIGERVKRVFFT